MSLKPGIEIRELVSMKSGMAEFYTPQTSHETMLVQIASQTIDDMFVHRHQTDQLLVVRGSFVLVILHDRQYQYILLTADQPKVVTIPPYVPHAAINLSDEPCMLINAVLLNGQPDRRDYQPLRPPFKYDLNQVQKLVPSWNYPLSA
jgi:dTDP-4-dehydrorhamnose 3,5-epimerase-like enzyme